MEFALDFEGREISLKYCINGMLQLFVRALANVFEQLNSFLANDIYPYLIIFYRKRKSGFFFYGDGSTEEMNVLSCFLTLGGVFTKFTSYSLLF